MTLIEMNLVGREAGSVMIALGKISEATEGPGSVKIIMSSGNEYTVTTETFVAAMNAVEGSKYLKLQREETTTETTVEA